MSTRLAIENTTSLTLVAAPASCRLRDTSIPGMCFADNICGEIVIDGKIVVCVVRRVIEMIFPYL